MIPLHASRVLGVGHSSFSYGVKAFRALQTAYIRLLQNPFYDPDEHTPMAAKEGRGKGSQITSRKLIEEVERIGMNWRPGANL